MNKKEELIDWSQFLLPSKMRPGRFLRNPWKHYDELGNAQDFIEAMGLELNGLYANESDPPDAIYRIAGKVVGVEITFCGAARPEERSDFWDQPKFIESLKATIEKKNEHAGLRAVASQYDELWLFILCSGGNLVSTYVEGFVKDASFSAELFAQIWLKLDYEPSTIGHGKHPLYRLK